MLQIRVDFAPDVIKLRPLLCRLLKDLAGKLGSILCLLKSMKIRICALSWDENCKNLANEIDKLREKLGKKIAIDSPSH